MRYFSAFPPVFLLLVTAPPAAAANICNETVPGNRIIDGIPAYQQCADSSSGAIYSNNGVDTATSSGGADWARTQFSGGYQCTELAHRYLHFKWGIKSVPNGNAGVWCDGAMPAGLEKTTTPVHGDLIVFGPGACGADQTTGHVAIVDVVNASSTVTFIEQNRANRRTCAIDTATCFLHVIANTGAALDGGAPDAAAPDGGADSAPEVGGRPDRPADRQRLDLPGGGGAAGTGGVLGLGGGGGDSGSGGAGGAGGQSAGTSTQTSPTGHGGASTQTSPTGSGGASAQTSAPGTGGATSPTDPPSDGAEGCACHLGDGRTPDHGSGLVFLLLLAGAALARRRRH